MMSGKRVYKFEACGWDRFAPHANTPADGTLVRKCQPTGCPPNGTMGHCFVADVEGNFLGLVLLSSLQPVSKVPA